MAKFDRKAQQLKARVQFVRGSVRKGKGAVLTDAETDTMTDAQVEDEIVLGNLEAVDREAEAEAPAGGEGEAGDKAGDPPATGGRKPAGGK